MIPLCSRFDSVLFTPKMSAIASCGNYSRFPNQCRRNRAYPCVTHALGDHETQLPDSSPTPNSFQHQSSANHSPSSPHRSHAAPSNPPKFVTHPLASELVYKRFTVADFIPVMFGGFHASPESV